MENSNIIQLFIIVNCLSGWPVFIVALWEHSLTKDTHPSFNISPFGKELHSSSLSSLFFLSILWTICTQVLFTIEALRLYITVTYKFAYMEYIF